MDILYSGFLPNQRLRVRVALEMCTRYKKVVRGYKDIESYFTQMTLEVMI
jgi:hypothetical protein